MRTMRRLLFKNNFRESEVVAVRQADMNAADAHSVRMLARSTAQFDGGPPARFPDHLDVHPAHRLARNLQSQGAPLV